MQPGDNDYSTIEKNGHSGAILASGPAVFHYQPDANGNRQYLSVRDAAALQSYPNDYEFVGTVEGKYKQVGNSVPCGLATAVACSAAEVLRFVYDGENIDILKACRNPVRLL